MNKDWEIAEYEFPKQCEQCGSESIIARFLYDPGGCIGRYVCTDCGFSRSLAKAKNLKKRTSGPLTHWAYQIKKQQPFCYVCGSREDLEAHHIIPVSHSEAHKFLQSNGITLCKRCHRLVHFDPDTGKYDS